MNVFKKASSTVIILLALAFSTQAQQESSGGVSSIIWTNGSGMPNLKFTLNSKLVSENWLPGAYGGAGPVESINWSASFSPVQPAMGFTETFNVENRSSSIAVLIGDFKSFTNEDMQEAFPNIVEMNTPSGFKKMGPRGYTRAALLRFPIQKDASASYPVYLLNGIPESTVKLTFRDGKIFNLDYGKPETYVAQAENEVHLAIEVDSKKEIVGFRLDSLERGGVLVFYRKPGHAQTEKVFVNLDSLESLEYRAANPEAEEPEEN